MVSVGASSGYQESNNYDRGNYLRTVCHSLSHIFCGCVANQTDAPSMELTFRGIKSISGEHYSNKGLTPSEKLDKQLVFALKDPAGNETWASKQQNIASRFCAIFRRETSQFVRNINFIESSLTSQNREDLRKVAVAQEQGGREYQEDGYLPATEICFRWGDQEKRGLLFGVFDGHEDDGNISAQLRVRLPKALKKMLEKASGSCTELNDDVITDAFVQVFHDLSKAFFESRAVYGGATVTCAFQIDDKIYFPNIGDSRTILVGDAKTYQLTEDANIAKGRFQKWHRKMGNSIIWKGCWRVTHKSSDICLMPARDVGSHKWMCSRPKITRVWIGAHKQRRLCCKPDDILALFSDGLSDEATTKEIGKAIRQLNKKGMPLQDIANSLAKSAARSAGRESDNITVMLVRVKDLEQKG